MAETTNNSVSLTGGLPLVRVKMTSRGPQLDDGREDVPKFVSPLPQSYRDLDVFDDPLPMSTGVPILPAQSAQIMGRGVFEIGRFVISNAGTAGGAADWVVNDIKINDVSQFVQSGDVGGAVFATDAPAKNKFVRFAPLLARDNIVVVVVTYIGLNERGCPFFGALVGCP